MTRGVGTTSRAVKKPSRKAARPRRAPKTAPSSAQSNPSIDDPQEQISSLRRERDEALEREAATAKVLRVISSSQGELQPIFEAILENAVRICEAKFGMLFRFDGDAFHLTATLNLPPELADYLRQRGLYRPGAGLPLHRLLQAKAVVHTVDQAVEQAQPPSAKLGSARTHIAVPMLKEGRVVGAIAIYRQEVRPFTDKQIELVQNFADQAVIAIENARLLNELRQRTDDLSESLEQQTATSEVLKVISSSPGELKPVFIAILENATRICDASFGNLLMREGRNFRRAAIHNAPPAMAENWERRPVIEPGQAPMVDRMAATKAVFHFADVAAKYPDDPMTKYGGARSFVTVPMLKDGELIGIIGIYRQVVQPFTEKQVALLQNFAAQAVIAIENTRLLNELRESLQQQTATADVLKVISRSTFDLQSVLNTLAQSAAELCEAYDCIIFLPEGGKLHIKAMHGPIGSGATEFEIGRGWVSGRAFVDRAPVHVPDLSTSEEFPEGREMARRRGHRTILSVPMLRGTEAIGVISIRRFEVKAFTEKQIEVVKTFADQAVIAIENVRLFDEVQARTRDLSESLEQQTATSEVLKVISSSPGELEPVFRAMLEKAVNICDAKFGLLFRWEGDAFRTVAMHDLPQAFADERRRNPVLRPNPRTALGRLVETKRTIQVDDVRADPSQAGRHIIGAGGARTLISVPMLKENELVGAIGIYRQEVRPFTDKQIELVENFAAQAVIAIENTRLLNELRESLGQQTATADVLKIISSSPGDLQPVFQAILDNATRLCEATFGTLALLEGEVFHRVALHNAAPDYVAAHQHDTLISRDSAGSLYRLLDTNEVVNVTDLRVEGPHERIAKLGGARSLLVVPMLKEGKLIGGIAVYRQEVRPFVGKQIDLMKNFAAQAVIAIENARLLNELRESLQQQTATADVLKVISSSPGDLNPVFEAILENATRICEAKYGLMFLHENGTIRTCAWHGVPPALAEERRRNPIIRPSPKTAIARVLGSKQTVHVADILAEPEYMNTPAGFTRPGIVQFGGARTELAVPMLKEGELVGIIVIYRTEARPFTDKQIELVTSFGAQAVIAIENARLLNELRTRTNELAQSVGELQALGEVSQAVNSTLDLGTVLTTIVGRAVQLSRTDAGAIYVFVEERREFRLHATYGMSETMIAAISDQRIGLEDRNNVAIATTERRPVQVADTRDEPASAVNDIVLREGYRSLLIIPLLRPDHIVGALVVRRKTPGEFPQSTIDLLQTFADQSVVAIQNARLYENVEARTRELAASLENLRATQDRLVQTQKLASLGQLTAGIAHEIKNPLNFVNNFSAVSVELIDELRQGLTGPLDDKLRAQISEIADILQGNLDKVVQHGKRADAIVKNMLLHSRQGSAEHRPVDINALVEESLNLAYHGARAEKQDFNITLERSLDPSAGEVDVFPQDITRVLLNLISNGFYAATKRKAQADGGYEPTLMAATRNLGDRVEIRIRDNGTGIPAEVKEQMFNPFFTTKPAGEGTGLGLSISHDVIVKQHGGSIEVDTQPGEFTEIKITLPCSGAFPTEPTAHA